MFCLVTVYSCNIEMKKVRKEVKDGMYGWLCCVVVHVSIQIPAVAILSLSAACPAGYPLSNLPWQSFFRFWVVYFAMLVTSESTAQVCCLANSSQTQCLLVSLSALMRRTRAGLLSGR